MHHDFHLNVAHLPLTWMSPIESNDDFQNHLL